MRHLALLRGINVSGHNLIKMEQLKNILETAGFQNVETYIQSGNVFLSSPETHLPGIGFAINQLIFKQLGLDVPVVMLSKTDLEKAISQNPFLKDPQVDTKKCYVAFLSKNLGINAINDLKISQFKPDEAIVHDNMIYIKYHIGAGKTKLDQKYIEKKLNVTATIRNWNTVSKLLELYHDK
ncbi:hypothetical protein B0A58_09870 [Flavobacterium branchiophilum NBRC 15030 = ATCC 35035]|uniref:Uncharacterized protein (DUF1697 family) n=1 Tax=Flavobacterium branchiophilum TaxID=55197 RepID=A0A543G5H7_9FLAO|nr:DUF1697 domain-containing protein [Flavobacterium branchiophilum]OXA74797.1 hypothetical protein B0A58_09870 [Flavobacterium branchiophilum NBRC 15030 = ATCC 35035]TQM41340.1 uncharacterized protein (DUF1697 family) [Flavobacterium branchiophilum]GEM55031.1 hypothetical protein FB1_12520 [Flavobacterium branchiophilum NBRC 15030 = ATCC 35035]